MEIRPVHPDELEEVGRLTAQAYLGAGYVDPDDDYATELTDAADRAREAEVWVASLDQDPARDSPSRKGSASFSGIRRRSKPCS